MYYGQEKEKEINLMISRIEIGNKDQFRDDIYHSDFSHNIFALEDK